MTSQEMAPQDLPTTPAATGERADWLETLAKHRHFLRFTTRDLTDEQAALRTTASALCLGGLIKHVTAVERGWAAFIRHGAAAMEQSWGTEEAGQDDRDEQTGKGGQSDRGAWDDGFRMLPGETLAGVLADYEKAAADTDELVATLADLGAAQPLPTAPWFEPGAQWSARRVLMHIVTETAQHSGHADIIRESLDGAQSMA
ncbi:DinB family protein [Streptomyces sp. NPDC004111]|uniref:DinB family protein n=1 Tax=Streptomyces sp. NPDC004111 TaxID=3364690 RepID=UPI0036955A08